MPKENVTTAKVEVHPKQCDRRLKNIGQLHYDSITVAGLAEALDFLLADRQLAPAAAVAIVAREKAKTLCDDLEAHYDRADDPNKEDWA